MPKRIAAADRDDEVGHAAHCRVVLGDRVRDAAADAERRKRDDEGVRQTPEDVDRAVYEADQDARDEHRDDDDRRGIGHLEQQAADDGRQRQIGADRKVDAAGEDNEVLAERDDRDDRGLGEDVADVARLQKDRRRDADQEDQDRENEQWTDAEQAQRKRNRGRPRPGSRLAGRSTPSPVAPPPVPPAGCFLLIKSQHTVAWSTCFL